jgi:protein-S-isoprenylcysteine O-methyltransferase Ste14
VVLLVSWKYGFESIPLGGFPGFVVALFSALLGLGCLTVAVVIHRGFPKEHSKASDFAQLLTTGPYSHVRHPFYSSLIALDYFASLAFLSLYGIIASTFLLPAWWYLALSEERGLAQEWGQAYVEYRKVTPMFFPRYRRKKEDEARPDVAHA